MLHALFQLRPPPLMARNRSKLMEKPKNHLRATRLHSFLFRERMVLIIVLDNELDDSRLEKSHRLFSDAGIDRYDLIQSLFWII